MPHRTQGHSWKTRRREDDDDTLINARVAAPRPPPRRRPRKIRFTLPAIEQSRLNKKAVSSSRCFSVWIGTRCNHLLYTTSLDRVNLIDLTPLFKYSKAYGFALIRTEGEIKVCRWLREMSSCSCLTVLPGPAWVLLSKTNIPLFPLCTHEPRITQPYMHPWQAR